MNDACCAITSELATVGVSPLALAVVEKWQLHSGAPVPVWSGVVVLTSVYATIEPVPREASGVAQVLSVQKFQV